MFKILLYQLICVALFYTPIKAQILFVDRETGSDTIIKPYYYCLNASFANDKQKNSLLSFTQNSELTYISSHNILFLMYLQNDIELNGHRYLENNGMFQLRLRDNDTRQWFPDAIAQVQWNGIWGMDYRYTIGASMRKKINDLKTLDAYISGGVFYEIEKWNTKGVTFAYTAQDLPSSIYRNIWRFNLHFKTAFKPNRFSDIVCINYLQFPLNNQFLKPRWVSALNWYFNINESLNFVLTYDHNFDSYRPLPIDVYYYGLAIGVQAKW
jgi:hypothetical protein